MMKKQKLYVIAFALLLTLGISGCKKYPQGPTVSLRTKSERLSNLWKLEAYTENSIDKTLEYNTTHPKFIWQFGQDGSYSIFNNNLVSESGTWKFANGKTEIQLTPQASTKTTTYTLLMLKEKELWYSNADSIFVREWHFVPN